MEGDIPRHFIEGTSITLPMREGEGDGADREVQLVQSGILSLIYGITGRTMTLIHTSWSGKETILLDNMLYEDTPRAVSPIKRRFFADFYGKRVIYRNYDQKLTLYDLEEGTERSLILPLSHSQKNILDILFLEGDKIFMTIQYLRHMMIEGADMTKTKEYFRGCQRDVELTFSVTSDDCYVIPQESFHQTGKEAFPFNLELGESGSFVILNPFPDRTNQNLPFCKLIDLYQGERYFIYKEQCKGRYITPPFEIAIVRRMNDSTISEQLEKARTKVWTALIAALNEIIGAPREDMYSITPQNLIPLLGRTIIGIQVITRIENRNDLLFYSLLTGEIHHVRLTSCNSEALRVSSDKGSDQFLIHDRTNRTVQKITFNRNWSADLQGQGKLFPEVSRYFYQLFLILYLSEGSSDLPVEVILHILSFLYHPYF